MNHERTSGDVCTLYIICICEIQDVTTDKHQLCVTGRSIDWDGVKFHLCGQILQPVHVIDY